MTTLVKDPGKQRTPMDPDAKAAWLEALRSGQYTQDTGALFTGRGHCCLGVLCEVQGVTALRGEDRRFYVFSDDDMLTDDIPLGWRGIGRPANTYLVHMNDYLGKSFLDIADWIDANL